LNLRGLCRKRFDKKRHGFDKKRSGLGLFYS
jgi:hypothetical protein